MTIPSERVSRYGPGMSSWRSGAGIARAVTTIALVFSALTGWAAGFESHCSVHGGTAHVVAEPHEHPSDLPSPAWTGPDGHDCDHCPPSQCSRVVSCAMSAGMALAARAVPPTGLTVHVVDLPGESDKQPHSPIQPPTPPPQLLS